MPGLFFAPKEAEVGLFYRDFSHIWNPQNRDFSHISPRKPEVFVTIDFETRSFCHTNPKFLSHNGGKNPKFLSH